MSQTKHIGNGVKVTNFGQKCKLEAQTYGDNMHYILLTPEMVKAMLNFLIENGWKFWAEPTPPK